MKKELSMFMSLCHTTFKVVNDRSLSYLQLLQHASNFQFHEINFIFLLITQLSDSTKIGDCLQR